MLELSWELEPELGWSGAPPRMMRAGLLGQHRSGGRAGPEGMPAVYMRIAGWVAILLSSDLLRGRGVRTTCTS